MTSQPAQVRLPPIQEMVAQSHIASRHRGQYSLAQEHSAEEGGNILSQPWTFLHVQGT
ncbi:hypothetical protein Micbo1qcDRAFT_169660, partial [Microdochium bolleyi]